MKLICAHKLSECLNFVSLFITPSKGVLPYNSVCLGLPRWSAQFFVNSLKILHNCLCSLSLSSRERERETEREGDEKKMFPRR